MSTRDKLVDLINDMRPSDPHVIPGGRWPEALANQILGRYAVVEQPPIPVPHEHDNGGDRWFLSGLVVGAESGGVWTRMAFGGTYTPNGARTLAAVLIAAADRAEARS